MKYFGDNIDWDLGKYLSEIGRITDQVHSSIQKVSDCLSQVKMDIPQVEIIEDFGSAEIDGSLLQSLVDLSDDLHNQSFYNSLIISIYSYLEYCLVELCELIDLYEKPNRRYNNIGGSGIFKCMDFFGNNFDFYLTQFDNWNEIKLLQNIRNLIAHYNSNLYTENGLNIKKQPYYNELNRNRNIRITSSGYFFITEIDYIKRMADLSGELINFAINGMKTELQHKPGK